MVSNKRYTRQHYMDLYTMGKKPVIVTYREVRENVLEFYFEQVKGTNFRYLRIEQDGVLVENSGFSVSEISFLRSFIKNNIRSIWKEYMEVVENADSI